MCSPDPISSISNGANITPVTIVVCYVHVQGALVNTASSFGMVGAHYATSYCASKGGVINLTRQLATDYGTLRCTHPMACTALCVVAYSIYVRSSVSLSAQMSMYTQHAA
jgi:NAD(P)-dependent dehydrogenase (short-subunit alcohol dehydrogenase family)